MAKENQKDKVSLLEEPFDPYKILKSPLATEKCIRAVEFENVLTFSIHTRATKKDVKKAVENLFKVAVDRVNLQNSFTGNKKAHVKLKTSSLASDVSADLGFI